MDRYDKTSPEERMERHRGHGDDGLRTKRETVMFGIRNTLNLIFMLGAIAGVICYLYADKEKGIYIILGAMVFKIMESAIRILRI